ncbi:hypothetical protein GN956_G25295 [Arapaima gigas]
MTDAGPSADDAGAPSIAPRCRRTHWLIALGREFSSILRRGPRAGLAVALRGSSDSKRSLCGGVTCGT